MATTKKKVATTMNKYSYLFVTGAEFLSSHTTGILEAPDDKTALSEVEKLINKYGLDDDAQGTAYVHLVNMTQERVAYDDYLDIEDPEEEEEEED